MHDGSDPESLKADEQMRAATEKLRKLAWSPPPDEAPTESSSSEDVTISDDVTIELPEDEVSQP